MAKKTKRTIYTSPAGIAVFPWLNRPDTKFVSEANPAGMYKTDLAFSPKEFESEQVLLKGRPVTNPEDASSWLSLKGLIDGAVAISVEEAKKEHKKFARSIVPYYPYLDEINDEGELTGRVLVRYKQNAQIKTKDGRLLNIIIPIFDARGAPLKLDVYGGSLIKVAFSMRKTWMAKDKQAGVRLDMSAAQVLKLVEYSKDAASFGFEVSDEPDEEAPWEDDDGDQEDF